MKYFLSLPLIFFISLPGYCQEEKKVLNASNYEQAVRFLGFNTSPLIDRAGVQPNWLNDGRFWYEVSVGDEKEFVLVDPSKASRSTAQSKEALPVNLQEEQKNSPSGKGNRAEVVSPDGQKTVFIRDWNLWMRNQAGEEILLTSDGIENFGYATDNAGWRKSDRPIVLWSPDSRKIATYQQDQRHVSNMYLVTTNVGEPTLEEWKYPLPQDEDIIRIQRIIIEVDTPKVIRLQMPADPRRGTLCDDISCSGAFDDNQWNGDATKLMFVSSSRDHKEAKVRIADAQTGQVLDIFEEVVETQYESGQGAINWKYLPATKEIIWYSERDNWGHLYLYNAETGKLKNQITKGDFVVTRVLKVDEHTKKIYFLANGREKGRDPYFSHFYSVNLNGKNLKLLTPENGNHTVSLSPNGNYFIDTFSQPHVPTVSELRNLEGKLILPLEKADISRLVATGWRPPRPVAVKSHKGDFDLYGLMFTPTHLDESQKYPVVNYIYPGPQGGGVGNRSFMTARSDHQALAELGFIVVVIDGTCNPGRSKAFHDTCYGNMADNTLEDQMAGLRQLAEQHPYIDLERVGMWGHSGGGYATAAALFRYPEFYKVGISESGNHDNRNYEDDWGERYIGLLKKDGEGKDNYEAQANQKFAHKLQGKLLLAHGGMDDNVPPYNTYLVVDALIKANKDFDLILFPNARHGFGQDTYYMMRRRWDYFVEHLMGAQPPMEFEIKR
ncbi:S9 family peptidase [soil metagenome]